MHCIAALDAYYVKISDHTKDILCVTLGFERQQGFPVKH